MAIELKETSGGRVLEVQVTGERTHGDYQSCMATFERLQ